MNYIEDVLAINKYDFINVGGSAALKYLLYISSSESVTNIDINDIDIYVDISHEDFNIKLLGKFIHDILNISDFKTTMYADNSVIHRNTMRGVANRYITYINNISYLSNDELVNREYSNILFLQKLISDNISIDLIVIGQNIEEYINENYDLTCCMNYIDRYGDVQSMHKEYTIRGVASIEFNMIVKNLLNIRKAGKYMNRLDKYIKRGYRIYIKDNCKCSEVDCFHSVNLTAKKMKQIQTMVVNVMTYGHRHPNRYSCADGWKIKRNIQGIETIIPWDTFAHLFRQHNAKKIFTQVFRHIINMNSMDQVLGSPKFIEIDLYHSFENE